MYANIQKGKSRQPNFRMKIFLTFVGKISRNKIFQFSDNSNIWVSFSVEFNNSRGYFGGQIDTVCGDGI